MRRFRLRFVYLAAIPLILILLARASPASAPHVPHDPPFVICVFFWCIRALLLWIGLLLLLLWAELRNEEIR
jgi:hypothetical protein